MTRLVQAALCVAGFLALAATTGAQSITTVAGGGSTDGRRAESAGILYPRELEVDEFGNLYVVVPSENKVRLVRGSSGVISTFAGVGTAGSTGDGGAAVEAQLLRPVSITLSGDRLFVSESNKIRQVSLSTARIQTLAGAEPGFSDGPLGDSRFSDIRGLASDGDRLLFVADAGNRRIRRIDLETGTVSTIAGVGASAWTGDNGPAIDAGIGFPAGLLYKNGELYFVDTDHQVIRSVHLGTGLIRHVAGSGISGFAGDGGPAVAASFSMEPGNATSPVPVKLAATEDGDLLVPDYGNGRIRIVRRLDGRIDTLIGGGSVRDYESTVEATDLELCCPAAVAVDRAGNFYFTDLLNSVIYRMSTSSSGVVRYAGGNSSAFGDGGPADAAGFVLPTGVAWTGDGNVLVVDSIEATVRQVDLGTKSIDRVAGGGQLDEDDIDAQSASLGRPSGIAVGPNGDTYILDEASNRLRVIKHSTGLIRTLAGNGNEGFSPDGTLALQASLDLNVTDCCVDHAGIAVGSNGDIYFSEPGNGRVRRLVAGSGEILTVAGNGTESMSADDAPATSTSLTYPMGLAIDEARGFLYVGEGTQNRDPVDDSYRVRRINLETGMIDTVAGTGSQGFGSDDVPATTSDIWAPLSLAVESDGNVLIADPPRIRRLNTNTGSISTIAGSPGNSAPLGDFGPAKAAGVRGVSWIALRDGDLLVADVGNNRVRLIASCYESTDPPLLLQPGNLETATSTSPILTWSHVPDAFSYDLYLDTGSASTLVASGLTATRFVPSNLLLGSTYSWRVVAKGDPFCPNPAEATSQTFTFATEPACAAPPAPSLTTPPDGSSVSGTLTTLQWAAAPGAGAYDVYFGTSPNPPFLQQVTGTSTSVSPLVPGTVYYWRVVARASCFSIYATSSLVASFTTGGSCPAPGTFGLSFPLTGATNTSIAPTLSWSTSNGASSYDLYLGTTTPPQLFMPDIRSTSVAVSGLFPGRTYHWFVRARSACNASESLDSPTSIFTTTTACSAPSATSITVAPPAAVSVGQPYVIAWNAASGLDPGGLYEIQRSTSAAFTLGLESQQLESTAGSFVASSPVTYFHRVRAVPACGEASASAFSPIVVVPAVAAGARVVFTSQPPAVLSSLGQPIENKRASFTLENVGDAPVTVRVSGSPIDSIRFFEVFDTFGGADPTVELAPGSPREFEIRFSGPPNDTPASYQGVILVEPGTPLEVVPYAFVNLKVGNEAAAVPEILVAGVPGEYVAFPGFPATQPDTSREAITIEVRNPGSEPMEVGAEIGPDAWLVPEPGWNALPIPPGSTRALRLYTDRTRALDGSALPRYSYLTIRTRTGASARVLVQDSDVAAQGALRDPLGGAARSYVVPEVVSEGGAISQVRLSNLGSEPVEATLYFTPRDVDGFDPVRVPSARVVVPASEVVSLSDPLRLLFGLSGRGQLEVRAPGAAIGRLTVSASIVSPSSPDRRLAEIPVLQRTEGATAGVSHLVPGVTSNASTRTDLVLVETSGQEVMDALVALVDATGTRRGETRVRVPRYGMKLVTDIASTLGGGGLTAARLEVLAAGGGGSLVALGKVVDRASGTASIQVGQPVVPGSSGKSARLRRAYGLEPEAEGVKTIVIPFVSSGVVSSTASTLVGLTSSLATPVPIDATFRPASGSGSTSATINLAAGGATEFRDILAQLFQLTGKQQGSVTMPVPDGVSVWSRSLASPVEGAPGGDNPAVPVGSELVTGFVKGANRALHLDGLSLAVDAARMARWAVVIAELGGFSGQVVVELTEPGSSVPIKRQTLTVPARGTLTLDSVFKAFGLEGKNPKQLTNVRCTIRPLPGSQALFTAVGVQIDPLSGEARVVSFSPAGGTRPSGPTLAGTGELPEPPDVPDRRRPVRR